MVLRKLHREFEAETNQELEINVEAEAAKKKTRELKQANKNSKQHKTTLREEPVLSDYYEHADEDEVPLPDGSVINKDDWIAVAFDNGWFPGKNNNTLFLLTL